MPAQTTAAQRRAAVEFRAKVKSDVNRSLRRLQHTQVPFALASAATAIAKRVQAAQTEALSATFDNPTPFTLRGVGISPATKTNLTAHVFVKDAQADYLEPYEAGGLQVLGSKSAMLTPITVGLNQYGNIPRTRLATLKAKPNVFIGPVRTKAGVINGVWQRPARPGSVPASRGKVASTPVARAGLKLLIEFTDPKPVTLSLHYAERAATVVRRVASAELDAAVRRALATAR